MSLSPATYEEAKARFKPLRRSQIRSASQKPDSSRKPLSANVVTRKRSSSKKVKRRKKLTNGQLKKKVWKEFSIFIRTREADAGGFTTCTTCGQRAHWKTMQAGHFIRGRLNANLFNEKGCNIQCYACNVGRQGNVVEYYEWMLAHHGPEVIVELKQQNNQTHKWRPGELQELLDRYRAINRASPLLQNETNL